MEVSLSKGGSYKYLLFFLLTCFSSQTKCYLHFEVFLDLDHFTTVCPIIFTSLHFRSNGKVCFGFFSSSLADAFPFSLFPNCTYSDHLNQVITPLTFQHDEVYFKIIRQNEPFSL